MNFAQTFSLLTLVAALGGCASTAKPGNYECTLNDTSAGKCASVGQAFKAAQGISGADAGSMQSVFEARGRQEAPTFGGAPVVGAQPSGYPDVGETGMPVFTQPKVLRVWVAPYVDANGNLRSGEYTYFATPGQWNYGDLKKPGAAASAMFAPARESNLGFTAVAPAVKGAPPAPAEAPRPASNPPAIGAGSASSTSAPAITQPYQRLTGN